MFEILTAICYIFKDISAVISLLMIMRYIFLDNIKRDPRKIVLLIILFFLNGFIGVLYFMKVEPTADDFMDLVSNILYIVTLRTMIDSCKTTKLIWVVMLYIMTVDMMYSLVSSVITLNLLAECIINSVIFSVVGISVYCFATKSKCNLLPKVFDEIPRWVFVAILIFDTTCYYKEFGISSEWYNAMYISSSVMLIGSFVYLFYKIFRISYEQTDIIKQFQVQTEHYSKLVAGETELRNFRHDYKNHMIVLNAYLESGKIDEARSYMDSMNASVEHASKKVSTGNFVVDAVLNNKIAVAIDKGIDIRFNGRVFADGISSQDICLVFSNLLDNAIEACEKVNGEKDIEIEASNRRGFFVLSITNSCETDTIKKGSIIKTTKNDKRNHGIGLKNVSVTAQKYGGALTTECQNNIFTADVIMKTKQPVGAQ